MIKNYSIVALRNIWRNLNYTIINVSGLSLGITCSLILFLMITFLTSYDDYHTHGDRIYRVVGSSVNNNGVEGYGAGVPAPLPEALRNEISGIESVLFISSHGKGGGLITIEENGNRRMFEEDEGFTYTDSLYFQFFDRKLIDGDAALNAPNEAVISQKLAKKYFGKSTPVGKIIRLDNTTDLRITGIMEDYPGNTNFPFDLLISFATVKSEMDKLGWGYVYSNDECYVMLRPGSKPADVDRQFPDLIKKYEDKEGKDETRRWLQPLSEIHHDTRFSNFGRATVGPESLWAMVSIALFLIVTACINFINLTTAIAVKRSKEVGIRKVLGSQRTQLIFQHLCETGTITLLSLPISLGLAELGLLYLNSFIDLDLHINFYDQRIILFLGTIWLVVTLASGLYPAFLMSGFSPILALKNTMANRSSGGFLLRRSLVIFQFVISQFLIVGTVILLAQMDYFNSKDLGFRKEAIINVPIPESENGRKKLTLKKEIERLAGVDRVSLCSRPPSSGSQSTNSFQLQGIGEDNDAQLKLVDANYVDLFELDLIAGKVPADLDTATGVMVNEKLVNTVGLEKAEDILGRTIKIWEKDLPVVGVVKDFHTVSLKHEISPVILFSDLPTYQMVSVRLKTQDFNSTIKQVEKVWSEQYSDYLFSFQFLDQDIAEFYDGTKKMSVLLILFSAIAIFIGCLGLYGLISFMAAAKEKEIGVRKVLGATTVQILGIFSGEFVKLILIAFLIASPLAGYVMNKWLQGFVYHIPLDWLMFIAGILCTLFIAFITVGYKSLQAARTNPADVLRTE
jgi:putative ABC transport system permease protein